MDDFTPNQIQAAYKAVPPQIRDYLGDPFVAPHIEEVGNKHGLSRVEAGILTQITAMLIIGLLKPTEYIAKLVDQLSITHPEAAKLAQEINHEILNPIKEALIRVHANAGPSSAMQRVAAKTLPNIVNPEPASGAPSISPKSNIVTPIQKIVTPQVNQSDPSPRTVAAPLSTLATKLGDTYRITPGISPGTSNMTAGTPTAPTSPKTPLPLTPATQQISPSPASRSPQPTTAVSPIHKTPAAPPRYTPPPSTTPPMSPPVSPPVPPPLTPIHTQPTPISRSASPTQPARYYPPSAPEESK